MREPAPSPRRRAGRLLGVLLGGLLLASLLLPGALQSWTDTRPDGPVRMIARAWSRPALSLSESLRLNEPVRILERLVERLSGVGEPTTSAPASPDAAVTSTNTVAPRKADWSDPLRILGVGDSLMLDLQYGLERVLEPRSDVVVEGRGALGFGFTVPFWDWEKDVVPDYERLVAEIHPDVVVVMLGANEFEGYAFEGEDLLPGTDRWREVLRLRSSDAVSRWRAGGAHVYWWTTPRMRDSRFKTDDLNEVWISTSVEWSPSVTVIDSMEVLGDANGAYQETVSDASGEQLPLRKEHGVHFHEIGADLLAVQLEEILVADGWLASD